MRIIVPYAAGGPIDVTARLMAERVKDSLGTVIIENRPGGGGNIGADVIAKAAPDGLTIGIAAVATHAINPWLYSKMPYDMVRDFTPVAHVASAPNLLVVTNSLPVKNVAELIAYMKANPDKLSFGSPGIGTSVHVSGELFKSLTGTQMQHVPYKGRQFAIPDLVGGSIQLMFDNMPSALPFIKDGRLIAIVVAAPQRLAALPDVPTFKEVGLEPVNRMAYYGLLGPKGLPRDVVDKIGAAARKVLEDPAVRKRIEDTGSLIVANTPEQFSAQIAAEFEVYRKLVDTQKLKLD